MSQRSFGQEISGNRQPNAELSSAQRAAIISKVEAGVLYKDIAAEFQITTKSIQRTLKRWKTYQTLESLPRSGRPEVVSRREKRVLYRLARREPKIQYGKLMEEAGLLHISKSTCYRRLKDEGLTKYRCKKRPKLTRGHALLRLQFARKYRHFNFKRRTIKFSDECTIERGQG
jgi:transposase